MVTARPGVDNALVSYIEGCFLPVWRDLHRHGRLLEASVFALTEKDSTPRQDPEWDYLILARLAHDFEVQELLAREAASASCEGAGDPPFTVLRTEVLATTRRSFYPAPSVALRDRVNEVQFLVEFIAVEETALALAEYRDLMRMYIGPANGTLVSGGMLYDFVALETTEVLDEVEGIPSWNQLHVSGDRPEYIVLDWDSLYADLFDRLYSTSLDSIWDRLPSTEQSPGDYSGRLLVELHVH